MQVVGELAGELGQRSLALLAIGVRERERGDPGSLGVAALAERQRQGLEHPLERALLHAVEHEERELERARGPQRRERDQVVAAQLGDPSQALAHALEHRASLASQLGRDPLVGRLVDRVLAAQPTKLVLARVAEHRLGQGPPVALELELALDREHLRGVGLQRLDDLAVLALADPELAAQQLEQRELGLGHDAVGMSLAHGLAVDGELLLFARLLGLEVREHAGRIVGRRVLELPLLEQLLGGPLLDEVLARPLPSLDQEHGRDQRDREGQHARPELELAQGRRAGEQIEQVEGRERGEREHPMPTQLFVGPHPRERPLEPREHPEARQHERGQADRRGHERGQPGREEEPGPGEQIGRDRLARPGPAEVGLPVAGAQPEVGVEAQHQARKRVVGHPLGLRFDVLPVAVLLVDVGAVLLAGRAGRALRVVLEPQRVGLGVDPLDDRDRADEVAPRLSGVAPVDQRGAQTQRDQ
ncbi:hypothetical protein ACNOYE_12735 [Nannocystaceae bacterium ST9]